MTFGTLIKRSIRFYWRTNIGVILGVAVGTAILVGALVVGDSVRNTLREMALSRLGNVNMALSNQNRYFRVNLADELENGLGAKTAPVLQMRGIATNSDGSTRVNRIQVLGVDERFWPLGSKETFESPTEDEAVVNERLAKQLGVKVGDDILIRVEKASLMPRDAPMSIGDDFSIALRLTVKAVALDKDFGRFSLQASQIPPFNAFVSIDWLQKKMDLLDRANVLLMSGDVKLEDADNILKSLWEPDDADLEIRELSKQNAVEIRSHRIFIDPPVANALRETLPDATWILTYFVNELRLGDTATPYSIVTAMSPGSPLIPTDMKKDEILINSWLAEDLRAKAGDEIEIKYFVFGPMRNLEERSEKFRVRAVLPLKGAALDSDLMPDFPGLAGVDNCRDWDPGVAIDLDKIRNKDEDYWDLYRGTPKAFITLETGQRLWGNRFGELTGIRYTPQGNNGLGELVLQIKKAIKSKLDPVSIGLFFQPVREQALKSSAQALDFGQLFLSLSFFLIIAASLLTGLLFAFGVQHRTEEIGTLLATGIPYRRIRRMFLLEGLILSLIGGIIGSGLGVFYTKVTLYALSTVWQGAVGAANFHFYANPLTMVIGGLSGIIVGMIAIRLTLFRQARHSVRELLAGDIEPEFKEASSKLIPRIICFALCVLSGVAALAMVTIAGMEKNTRAVGIFFGAGFLMLTWFVSLSYSYLRRRSRVVDRAVSKISTLGFRNSSRRRGRSLATIAILACGSFLIIAIGANRQDANINAEKRDSGTGGFAMYGESALPVLHDLNGEDGQKAYRLDKNEMEDVKFVQLRVHDGEDASCLNLNRVQNPNIMGVKASDLAQRKAFLFVKTVKPSSDPWSLLENNEDDNIINAIGDQNSIAWALGKSVGDLVPYTDERGKPFQIRIAGSVGNSILQGSFIISEDEFIKKFPSESGYRAFLIDAPFDKIPETSKTITSALRDVGLDLMPTADRLNAFNAVQNTYLSIFQALGGLALLLGSVGLGIVVLRNVMERRGELALMRAVGFQKKFLKWLVLSEHWLLLVFGLAAGVVSGLVAIIPMTQTPGAGFPYISMAITLCGIFLSGILWIWVSTTLALRGQFLDALRNE